MLLTKSFIAIGLIFKSLGKFLRSMLSEEDGSVSSSRVWMTIFSTVSIILLFKIVDHLLLVKDAGTLSTWLGNLPTLIFGLTGLSGGAYTANKVSTSISNAIASAKTATDKINSNPIVQAIEKKL